MMGNDTILQMRSITKEFSGVKALDDVNLEVKRGEVHAICGENGAGKSTLMKVLSGVWPNGSYSGVIEYEGEECRFQSIRDSEEKGIVIIHQELALSPYLSVAENIFLGTEKAKLGIIDWKQTNNSAQELLDKVGLKVDPQRRIADLGVGQQQLVEIAKALSKNVKLLILDEPTAALNDDDSSHLLELMNQLRNQGVTMIIISHKLNEIEQIADRTTIIRDGKTIGTAPVKGPEKIGQDEIIQMMVGRELTNLYPEHISNIGDPILEIENWTVKHPIDVSRKVVDGANLTLRKGEIVGLAGLMGAGRTELAMSIFGHSYGNYVSGTVCKNGKEIDVSTVSKAVSNGLAYVPEDRKVMGLNLIQDIRKNVSIVALKTLTKLGVIQAHQETQIVENYRKNLAIKTPSIDALTGSLSGGNQQKVVLAKWIFTHPDILILDEPTRGIDVGAKYEIYQIINQLADDGHAVLVISSELPELLGICDRIYTMSQGRITGQMPGDQATQESLMQLMTVEKDGVQ